MSKTSKSNVFLFFFLTSICCPILSESVRFPEGKDCVAWKTKKRLMLVSNLEPVGLNCKIKIETVSEGSKVRVKVAVPVSGFDSGDSTRDEHVLEILKSSEHPNILFVSEPQDPKEWKAGEPKELNGKLSVAGKETPITLSIEKKKDSSWAKGQLVSKFTTFGVEPPSVAGGVITKVEDYLELHFQAQVPSISTK